MILVESHVRREMGACLIERGLRIYTDLPKSWLVSCACELQIATCRLVYNNSIETLPSTVFGNLTALQELYVGVGEGMIERDDSGGCCGGVVAL